MSPHTIIGRLDSDTAAAYIGISPRTLERWRAAGAGPPYYRIGPRTLYYRAEDLCRWLASRRISPAELAVGAHAIDEVSVP